MKCPYCGNEVKDDINFCPVCGNSLKSVQTPDPEPEYGSEPSDGAENGVSNRRRIGLIVIIIAACAAAAILITFSLIRRNNIRNTSAAWVEETENLSDQDVSDEDTGERELAIEDITEVEDPNAEDEVHDTDVSDSSGTSGSAAGSSNGSEASASAASSSSGSEASASESEVTNIPFNMSDVTTVYSSSFLDEPQYGTSHPASNIVDGSLDNAWSEGVSGQGVGEYVLINFNNIYQLNGMTINSGYQKSEDLYYKNSRPKEIRITFADESYEDVTLEDVMGEQTVTFSHPVSTASVEIMILSVYPGSKYQDTLISEVSFY